MVCLHSRPTRQDTALQAVSVVSPIHPVHDTAMAAQPANIYPQIQANEANVVVCHTISMGGYFPQGSVDNAAIKAARGRCGRLERGRRADRSSEVYHGAHALQGAFGARLRPNRRNAQIQRHGQHFVGDSAGWSHYQAAYSLGVIQ